MQISYNILLAYQPLARGLNEIMSAGIKFA